jgi:hypothetical protein
MARSRRKADPVERKVWFNWPLVLGLIANFAVLALVASCVVHALSGPSSGAAQ